MNSLRSKLSVQFVVTNASTVVSFGLSMYLARILAPAEIGIFSIAAVLASFVHVFRDFGVVSFVRSEKNLTPEVLRTAMGVMMTASWVFGAVVFFAAPYAAAYYAQPGIASVLRVLGVGFFFIPFGSIPQAVLGRELDVRKATIVTGVSTVAYAGTCVVLANLGFSYMAFAWANLVNIMACAVTYSLLRPAGLPWMPSLKGWRRIVHFGGGSILTNALRAIDLAVPDLMLSKMSGASAVGLFSRANSTVNILNYITTPTIHYAALPYLAKAHHEGNDVAGKIRTAVAYLTGVIWPALAITAVLAHDIVSFLYGALWLDCAVVIPLLCAANAIQMMFYVLLPSFTGVGRPYLVALPLTLGVLVKIIAALSLFDGTLISFAKAYLLGEVATIPVYLYLARLHLNVSYRAWFGSIVRSAAATAMVLGAFLLVYPLLQRIDLLVLRLGAAGILWLLVWVAAIVLVRHPLCDELQRLRDVVRQKRALAAKSA